VTEKVVKKVDTEGIKKSTATIPHRIDTNGQPLPSLPKQQHQK
jgi:hypothetical protein